MYIYDGRSSGSPLCRGDRHTSVPRGSRRDRFYCVLGSLLAITRLLIATRNRIRRRRRMLAWLKKMPLFHLPGDVVITVRVSSSCFRYTPC